MKKTKSNGQPLVAQTQGNGGNVGKPPSEIPEGNKDPVSKNSSSPPKPITKKGQKAQKEERVSQILANLQRLYPDARCALEYETPVQLVVATILSAHCTDVRVNMVTPGLFKRYPDAKAFARANPSELETLIQSTGFFRNKAANIIACCQELVAVHGGLVPKTIEELVPLAGVGRKTANVVLGNAFGVPGITVDTHVGRLSRRMGLTQETQPVKVETELMEQIPQPLWTIFSHRMIYHGRQVCDAKKPRCGSCALASICPQTGVKKRGTPA